MKKKEFFLQFFFLFFPTLILFCWHTWTSLKEEDFIGNEMREGKDARKNSNLSGSLCFPVAGTSVLYKFSRTRTIQSHTRAWPSVFDIFINLRVSFFYILVFYFSTPMHYMNPDVCKILLSKSWACLNGVISGKLVDTTQQYKISLACYITAHTKCSFFSTGEK